MDNELRNHKKSDTAKWWLTLIAFILMGATILGLIGGYIVPKEPKIVAPIRIKAIKVSHHLAVSDFL